MIPSDPVEIVEIGPRDGLQNLKTVIPTQQKLNLIGLLAQTGLKQIQVGGFVSPKAIPQFHDIKSVVRNALSTIKGVSFSVLAPNLRGVQNALECGINNITFVFSASEAHNKNNVRKTPDESLIELEKITEIKKGRTDLEINVDLATTFGCPFVLNVPFDAVTQYAKRIYELGVTKITLCDTVGFGNPKQVFELVSMCRDLLPEVIFRCHFHNTRGLGLANALAAYIAGVRSFDSSIGGLGGCPYAPGATGNTSTEDLNFMFNEMGIDTGISTEKLFAATDYLKTIVSNVAMESHLYKAKQPCARELVLEQ